jgi:hypothetical protein
MNWDNEDKDIDLFSENKEKPLNNYLEKLEYLDNNQKSPQIKMKTMALDRKILFLMTEEIKKNEFDIEQYKKLSDEEKQEIYTKSFIKKFNDMTDFDKLYYNPKIAAEDFKNICEPVVRRYREFFFNFSIFLGISTYYLIKKPKLKFFTFHYIFGFGLVSMLSANNKYRSTLKIIKENPQYNKYLSINYLEENPVDNYI